jgi:predicted CxxxxCH...CXXCH cytochrome family protein
LLGALGGRDIEPPRRTGPPAYDPADATCTNVWCHGGAFDDSEASLTAPRWTTDGDQASCGSCHGLPPSDHAAGAQCATCHRQAPGDHVDGVVDLGDGSGTCSACHGDATSPAPPRGLAGETSPTTLAVGAHRSHLAGASLGRPVACNECHGVPSTILAPGHLDSDLPAEVVMASGTWNRDSATCTNGACHGAATPVWTRVGLGEAACGTCHGIPPASHDPATTVFDCVNCHPAFDEGQHMDGDVDL